MHQIFERDDSDTPINIGFFLEKNTTDFILYDLIDYQKLYFRDVYILTLEEGDGELALFCRANGIKWYGVKGKKFISRIIAVVYLCRREKIKALYINGYALSKFIFPLKIIAPKLHLVSIRHHNKVHHILGAKRAILIDKLAGKYSNSIIAVSNSAKETILKEGTAERKIAVIYNGVNSKRFLTFRNPYLERMEKHKWKLVALGRIVWEKNYQEMIQVMSDLAKRNVNFELNIYGNGPSIEIEKLKSQIQDLDLGDKVFVRGFTYDAPRTLMDSDILIHTAVDESLGMVIIEGYLAGIPIVSNTPAGVREIATVLGDKLAEKNLDLTDKLLLVIKEYDSFILTARTLQLRAQTIFDIREMGERYRKHFESTRNYLKELNRRY